MKKILTTRYVYSLLVCALGLFLVGCPEETGSPQECNDIEAMSGTYTTVVSGFIDGADSCVGVKQLLLVWTEEGSLSINGDSCYYGTHRLENGIHHDEASINGAWHVIHFEVTEGCADKFNAFSYKSVDGVRVMDLTYVGVREP